MGILTKEEKHLATKIRLFEDMLIRSKSMVEISTLQKELMKMRILLFKIQCERLGGGVTL